MSENEDKRLFKPEYYEKKARKSIEKQKKRFVSLVTIHILIKKYLTKIALVLNTLILVFMVRDINIGIVLFLLNQYIVLLYYLHLRKKERKDNE